MIKEFAFGTANRHHFQDVDKMQDWKKLDKDTFVSLYDYDDYVVEYYTQNKSLSGFDGMIYIPDEFVLDVDASSTEKGLEKLFALDGLLESLDIPSYKYFSGTGFHVHIPGKAFRWKPSKMLHLNVKDALTNAGIFNYADPSVTDKTRIIRVPNTKNSKSNLYKVAIPEKWLEDKDCEAKILKFAKMPQKIPDIIMECNPVFDVLTRTVKKQEIPNKIPEFISQGRSPDPVNYPCISGMLESVPMGKRHMVALRIASWFRWLYPEKTLRLVMENWRQQVSSGNSPFGVKEMDSIINSVYDGHNGQGCRYGCHDSIMDQYCKNTCRLYKSKKGQTIMDSDAMEEALIEFLRADSNPINFGDIYKTQDFPIYPGEVVILQAPPKSMKTMLLQNWVNAFKRPTYFIEMEMSPRQIWSRFVMIENKWSEIELRDHYQQMRNGMNEKFKYLTVDYSAPYANELEKRISMLPIKPEIVVVDHMGLFKSKQRDPNMKVEEASQAMMELAVKHNLIVIAVSEITKQAFNEGMNMASSKGSFRTAYNTNKLLSVTPRKSVSSGLIEQLHLKCEANREREHIDINLHVNNANITEMEVMNGTLEV